MQNNRKRFLSILLALVMVFSLLPVNAFAEEDEDSVLSEQFPEEVQNDEFIPLNLEEPVVENAEPAEITEQAAEEPAAEERGTTPIEEATQEETLLREQPAQVMQEEPLLQNFEEPAPAAEEPVAQAVPTREYSFTEQPKAEPDENGMITVTWETDFTARRVWVYRCALTEEWPENPEPCVKLNYEEITAGSFDLQPDADHRYCLAVWYGEGDEDGILSEEFTLPVPAAKDEPVILKEAKDEPKEFNEDPISEQPLQKDAEAGVAQEAKSVPEEKGTRSGEAFTSPPETGDADPEAGYTVTWETNFTPTRVCIVKRKLSNNTYSEHAEVPGPYSTSMSYHFDYLEASSDYNYLVYAYTEINCIMSTEFRVYNISRAFIESPADSVLNPGYNLTLAWTTNFTPTRIQLRYWNRGENEINARTVVNKTTGMNKTMWLPVSYDNLASSPHWVVAAYYGDGEYDYVTSNEFKIILTGREFTSSPANCSVSPDSVVGVQWTTDFMPTKIQIGYTYSATDFFPKVTITSGLANSMGQYLDYNTVASGGSTWCIAAYYAEGKVEFSENFTINCVPRSFTQSPEGFELSPGESHLLSWKTNFMPTKIELCYYNIYNSSYSASVTLTEDLNTSMSYNLDYAQLPADLTSQKNWVIRAYHGGGGILPYITSQEFQIERVRPQVLEMPEEIRISREGNALFTWGTNFVPVKVEIRAKFWNSYQVVKTVTTGLGKRMTKSLSASELTYGGFGASSVLVYAYYNYSTPVTTSYETSVIWLDANKCGDNLTWELSEGGTLTISGTGPMWDFDQASKPWHSQRSNIQRVVINDGVTTIGENAFYFCDNITNVSLPTSITEIGKQAFLLCMNLRSVYYDGFMIQAQQIVIKTGNSEFENASASYLYRSGELSSGVYWTVDGELDRLTISGSGGSGIHVTPPWQAWSEWITEIEIEEGIDTIWEDAFRDCSSVVVVGLPFSLQAVESGAFSACTGLSDVYYNGPLSDWTSLTYHIQAYNTPLTSAVIHTTERVGQLTDDLSWSVDDNGLLRIFVDGSGDETDIPNYTSATSTPWYGNYASDIVAVRMERGVTGIGNNAFRQLTHLSSVEIPYTVTYIGDYAFDSDSSLTSFIAPDGVTTIGAGAFRYCNGLEQIYLPESIMTLGTLAFGNCRGLKKVWLPGLIEAIPDRCFENCSKLEMVNIPVTVNSIGNAAFNSCSALIAEGGEVYYGGTSAQFAEIPGIDQYYLKNAWTVHFIPEEIAVNERNFPDAQFRAYVSENFDNDGSGWLTDAEITAVESFNDEDDNFTSLDGIEYFTELTHIYLVGAAPDLTSVDLSANTKLYSVDLSGNGNLAEINLEGLNELCYLDMSGNALTELHLTGLMDLENLSVSSNPITELDLSGLPLKELSCSNTALSSLDLSGKAELYCLNCYGSGISELDISSCPILVDAYENGTRTEKTDNGVPYVEYKKDTNHVLAVDEDCICITETDGLRIDADHFPDPVFRFYVSQSFDADHNGCLSDVEIMASESISMDSFEDLASVEGIEYFTELTSLELTNNENLTSADLSTNTKITYLDLSGNALSELNLAGLTVLKKLYVCENNLTSLDISGCPILLDAFRNGTKNETDDYVEYLLGENGINGYLQVDPSTRVKTDALDVTFGHTCSVQNNLKIYFKAKINDDENYSNVWLHVKRQVYSGATASSWEEFNITQYGIESGRYVFGYAGIAAAEMGDEIRATLHAVKDGEEYVSETDVYSIKTYAYNTLEKYAGNTRLCALLVDMLNYGAAAQMYFGRNTGNLVNAELTAAQHAMATSQAAGYISCEGEIPLEGSTAAVTTRTLSLGNAVVLRAYITFDGTPAAGTYVQFRYTSINGTYQTENVYYGSAGNFTYDSSRNRYQVNLSSLAPADFGQPVEIIVYDGSGMQISGVYTYSVETYVHNMMGREGYAELKTLLHALMSYSNGAKAYFQ